MIKKDLGEAVTIISCAEETAIELSTILQHKEFCLKILIRGIDFFKTGFIS
ncbi:hypothetical protein bcgnr5380_38910 [Bacillus cereus]